MAARIKEYGARVNGELYPCRLNDLIYSQGGVSTALGFVKPGSGNNFNGVGDFRALKRAGAIIRVTVRGTKSNGGTVTDRKSWDLWCVASNLSSAKGQLVNQSIDGYNIDTVAQKQTTRFR